MVRVIRRKSDMLPGIRTFRKIGSDIARSIAEYDAMQCRVNGYHQTGRYVEGRNARMPNWRQSLLMAPRDR